MNFVPQQTTTSWTKTAPHNQTKPSKYYSRTIARCLGVLDTISLFLVKSTVKLHLRMLHFFQLHSQVTAKIEQKTHSSRPFLSNHPPHLYSRAIFGTYLTIFAILDSDDITLNHIFHKTVYSRTRVGYAMATEITFGVLFLVTSISNPFDESTKSGICFALKFMGCPQF